MEASSQQQPRNPSSEDQQKLLWIQQQSEKERMFQVQQERLESLKKKEKHEQSAVASSEVKQRLQEFVLLKKQREAAAASGQTPSSSTPSGSGPGSPSSGTGIILDPVAHRHLLKQYIRQTALTRTSSKQQLQRLSFEEETEAAVAAQESSQNDLTRGSHPTPTKVRMIKRQYSQDVISSKSSFSHVYDSRSVVDLSSRSRRESSRDSTPDSGIRSFDHQDYVVPSSSSQQQHQPSVLHSTHLSSNIHPLPALHGGTPLFHGSLMDMMTSAASRPRNIHGCIPVIPPTGSSSASSSASSNASTSMYQQILVQQQQLQQQQLQQHLLHQQQTGQEGQSHDQSVSILGYHPGVPGAAVALLPEVNQYPQILPHSRLAFYHHSRGGLSRPLSRALSSPMVFVGNLDSSSHSPHGSNSNISGTTAQHSPPISSGIRFKFTTGIVYDNLMLKHQCICGDNNNHPEHGGRLQSIWARLQETGLTHRCERIRSRKSSLQEIRSCHSEAYTLLFGTSPLNRQKLDPSKLMDLPIKSFVMLPCGGIGVDGDTTWNELHTTSAARTAAGCVTELALKVAAGEVKNGFAIVRPPGHHAETQQAMGFCFFNNIAIAAKQVMTRMDMERILVVDWDVHHGNGLQQIFYEDPHVLYISLHRHDDGNFFPGTGDPTEVGHEDGMGFNVNIAWSGGLNPPNGDAEYLSAFRSIVLPIARDFDPEMILVACGFDAAAGHPPPMGGYKLSPACFGWMTRQLMTLARGKVVLSLEGGYDLPSICDSSQECVQSLLEEDYKPRISVEELNRRPNCNAVEALRRVVAIQDAHWPLLKRFAHLIDCSHVTAVGKESDESETVSALASLTMKNITSPPPPHSSNSNIVQQLQQSGAVRTGLTSSSSSLLRVKSESVSSDTSSDHANSSSVIVLPASSTSSSSHAVQPQKDKQIREQTSVSVLKMMHKTSEEGKSSSEEQEIDMKEDDDEPMDEDLPDQEGSKTPDLPCYGRHHEMSASKFEQNVGRNMSPHSQSQQPQNRKQRNNVSMISSHNCHGHKSHLHHQ